MKLRRAMIFAAGRGERMRPLTDSTPKPLLQVGGKTLIEWHLGKLAAIGIEQVVINTSYLADQFPLALGNGSRWNVRIDYINEGPIPLETGGGMLNALPLLGKDPFLLINGDIWLDMDFSILLEAPDSLAHLVMVSNPAHVANGDFAIDSDGTLVDHGPGRLTYSGVGVYRADLFDGWPMALTDRPGMHESPPRFPLVPLLRSAMQQRRISGEFFAGEWIDVGTPERLASLDSRLRAN